MTPPERFISVFGGGRDAAYPGRWNRTRIGAGALQETPSGLRLVSENTTTSQYSNAQLDDYATLHRSDFPWRPPLTLHIRARFSHGAGDGEQPGLRGTAGFGFWNDFLMSARAPTLPRAVWFFYASPPSDMRFDVGTPGCGWKAATIDAIRPATPLLLASAVGAVPLMNLPALYRRIWPHYQRWLGICEHIVPAEMDAWHSYTLEWEDSRVRFSVDGRVILECPHAPVGPLGLVAWLDNQYMVASPWGRLRRGLLATKDQQWLEISEIEIGLASSACGSRSRVACDPLLDAILVADADHADAHQDDEAADDPGRAPV
jgi:hypothetical protein